MLIALGVVGLVVANVSFTERKTVLDAGPIKITQEQQKVIPIPTIAGIAASSSASAWSSWAAPGLERPTKRPGEADVVLGEAVEDDLHAARLHHPFQPVIAVLAADGA